MRFTGQAAKAKLSPDEVARLASEGAAMTIDQVVAYALEGSEATPGG